MSPPQPRSVNVSLEVTIVPSLEDGQMAIACPECRSALGVLQPDPGWPELLLGTCDACHIWFLIAPMTDDGQARMIHLPVGDLSRHV